MMEAVGEFTRLDIYRLYEMPAEEFFAYVEYIRAREKRKADEIRRFQRR